MTHVDLRPALKPFLHQQSDLLHPEWRKPSTASGPAGLAREAPASINGETRASCTEVKPLRTHSRAGEFDRFLGLFQGQRRDMLLDQFLRAIEQDAGGFTGLFHREGSCRSPGPAVVLLTPDSVRAFLFAQAAKVCNPTRKTGLFGRRVAQGLVGGIVRRPLSFIPTPTDNPFARGGSGDSLFHQRYGFRFIGYVFQIKTQQTLAKRKQMNMSVD